MKLLTSAVLACTASLLSAADADTKPADASMDMMMAASGNQPLTFVQVSPIFERSCVKCHGPEKSKAGLRVDSLDAIRMGSSDGPIVKAGKPEESPLYTLCALPPDDDDHMPSKGDPLTSDELSILAAWIRTGSDLAASDIAADVPPPDPYAERSAALPVVDEALIVNLTLNGAVVDALSGDNRLLAVTIHHNDRDAFLAALTDVALLGQHILHLDLSRSALSESDLALLTTLPQLERLDLSSTAIGDLACDSVSSFTKLHWLNLSRTRVSDTGLQRIADLAELKKCYLWGTQTSTTGQDALHHALPDCQIFAGN